MSNERVNSEPVSTNTENGLFRSTQRFLLGWGGGKYLDEGGHGLRQTPHYRNIKTLDGIKPKTDFKSCSQSVGYLKRKNLLQAGAAAPPFWPFLHSSAFEQPDVSTIGLLSSGEQQHKFPLSPVIEGTL